MAVKPATRTQAISPFYVMDVLHRAKQQEAMGRDVIHMEIGEPDFPTPQPIIDAGIRLLQTGEVKYTPAAGLPELRAKIASFYQQRYGISVAANRIFVTPGASGAFLLALGASLNAGETLLMADPCYPCNSNFVSLFDGNTQAIAVDASTHYQLTASLIKQHWTASTKGVLVASPSNPTGTLIAPDELKQVIQAASSLGGCFYSDEIYHGLVYGQDATSALAYSDDVFVINSFSKYFGMTGWRVGWLVVPEAFIEVAEKLAQNIFIATATQSQYAALAAFDGETLLELERRRTEFAARRDFLYGHLLRLGFDIPVKPEGAFYIYAGCTRHTEDSFQFALDFLAAEGVAVTPGKDFGHHQAQHSLRFAYTTSMDKMAEAMQRLERFINRR
ncbi:MAG: pyridoxal phosphate-dependent aminotransferase [Methylovulum sp.]|nr:pyridoxal phosphate-dependent aminotransferase [Methylovulum sp.]